MTGQIFVISGSSGCGKTSLLRKLLAADLALRFSISYTTRPPRPDEVNGRDYFFVSPEQFRQMLRQGRFIEWVEQFGHYYGTARDWVEQALTQGQDLVFDLEIQGARALKELYPHGTFIFILPPALPTLERRLRQRADVPEAELQERLHQTRKDLQELHWYDYLVINDEFSQALAQLRAIVVAARCRTGIVWPRVQQRFTL